MQRSTPRQRQRERTSALNTGATSRPARPAASERDRPVPPQENPAEAEPDAVRTDLRVGPEAEPEIEGVTLTDRPIDDVFAEGKPVSVRLTKGTHPRSRESSAHRVGPLDPE